MWHCCWVKTLTPIINSRGYVQDVALHRRSDHWPLKMTKVLLCHFRVLRVVVLKCTIFLEIHGCCPVRDRLYSFASSVLLLHTLQQYLTLNHTASLKCSYFTQILLLLILMSSFLDRFLQLVLAVNTIFVSQISQDKICLENQVLTFFPLNPSS